MTWGGDNKKSKEYEVTKTNSAKYLSFGIDKELGESIGDANGDGWRCRDRDLTPACVSVPKAGVAMAVFLTIGGAYLTIYGLLVIYGFYVPNHPDGMWFRVVLGLLTFIPGVYHVRLALFAYLKVPGYNFEDFPEF